MASLMTRAPLDPPTTTTTCLSAGIPAHGRPNDRHPFHVEPASGLLKSQSYAVRQPTHGMVQQARMCIGLVQEYLGAGQPQHSQRAEGEHYRRAYEAPCAEDDVGTEPD